MWHFRSFNVSAKCRLPLSYRDKCHGFFLELRTRKAKLCKLWDKLHTRDMNVPLTKGAVEVSINLKLTELLFSLWLRVSSLIVVWCNFRLLPCALMFTFGPNGSSAVALPDQLKINFVTGWLKKKALRAIFVMKSKNNQAGSTEQSIFGL